MVSPYVHFLILVFFSSFVFAVVGMNNHVVCLYGSNVIIGPVAVDNGSTVIIGGMPSPIVFLSIIPFFFKSAVVPVCSVAQNFFSNNASMIFKASLLGVGFIAFAGRMVDYF